MWEKGFALQTTIGVTLLSMSGVYFASKKLKAFCYMSFVGLLWGGLKALALLYAALPCL